jgi:hypothetical protein
MRICLAFGAMLLCSIRLAPAAEQAPAGQKDATPRLVPPPQEIASPITDRFALRATYFRPSVTTQLRLDAQNGAPGTNLSAERDLGMADHRNQGRVEFLFRLRERNRLRVDYLLLDRSGDQILTRTVSFRNQTFNLNDRVRSELDWYMLNFTYMYSALRTERFEIGAGLGVHLLEAKARGEVLARNVREQASGVGAFLTPALDATWRISTRFALTARAQHLTASVNNFKGSLSDYHGDLQYRLRRNLSLGLGYTSVRAALDVSARSFPGRFDLNVSGPEFFFRASF